MIDGGWRRLAVIGFCWLLLALVGDCWRWLAMVGGVWRWLAVVGRGLPVVGRGCRWLMVDDGVALVGDGSGDGWRCLAMVLADLRW